MARRNQQFNLVLTLAALVTCATAAIGAQSQSGRAQKPTSGGPGTPAVLPDYTIGIADIIHVHVFEAKELTGQFTVRPDGKFGIPQLGEMKALGLTTTELAQVIAEASRKFFDPPPNITVSVVEIRSRTVTITGSGVAKPLQFQLIEPTNIVEAITKAGWFTDFANKKEIQVIHAERRPDGSQWTEIINYEHIERRVNLDKNLIQLRVGDVVIVKGG